MSDDDDDDGLEYDSYDEADDDRAAFDFSYFSRTAPAAAEEDDDERSTPVVLPPPPLGGAGEERQRPEYLVTDAVSYYNLAAMFVLLDAHVNTGYKLTALVEQNNDNIEFEW